MSLSIKPSRSTKLVLKGCAILCGYALWHSISTHQKITITRTIPVCVYNNDPDTSIEIPETISVTCSGTRKELFKLAFDSAVHLDAHLIEPGTHEKKITAEQIVLPESVRLLHYCPTSLTLVKKSKELVTQ